MDMDHFTFRMATTVLFGNGIVEQLPVKLREFDNDRILIVTDKGIRQAGLLDPLERRLANAGFHVTVFDDVEPDPGLDTVHRGAAFFKEQRSNFIVALGGGSPMDTAKGIRILADHGGNVRDYVGLNKVPGRSSIPLVTIPTTSGTGSEVTIFAVLSDWEQNLKITINSPYLAADLALVDPLLTISVPPLITAATGIDALAHAIETYVSNLAQPPADALALKAIEVIGANLRAAVANGSKTEPRTGMSLGSLLAGMAFNNAFLGITHSLGAALSGRAHVGHGLAIGSLLPYVMEYNTIANFEKYRMIALALGEEINGLNQRDAAHAAATAVRHLIEDIQLPSRLREFGVKEEDLKEMASNAIGHGMVKMNPRQPKESDLLALLRKAF